MLSDEETVIEAKLQRAAESVAQARHDVEAAVEFLKGRIGAADPGNLLRSVDTFALMTEIEATASVLLQNAEKFGLCGAMIVTRHFAMGGGTSRAVAWVEEVTRAREAGVERTRSACGCANCRKTRADAIAAAVAISTKAVKEPNEAR